jgi:hypothetical protein
MLNETVDYQFQFRFLTQGKFALVDSHFRNIWLVLDNQEHAHAIRDVFRGKLSLLVCDLSVFENFESVGYKITSHTCLDWQLPTTDQTFLITPSMSNPVFDQTQTCYHSPDRASLLNEPAKCLLDPVRQLELQDQLLLYNRILELRNEVKATSAESVKFIDQINKIFLVEIKIGNIIEQLYQLSKQYIGIINFFPSCIITTIRKNLYE